MRLMCSLARRVPPLVRPAAEATVARAARTASVTRAAPVIGPVVSRSRSAPAGAAGWAATLAAPRAADATPDTRAEAPIGSACVPCESPPCDGTSTSGGGAMPGALV
jgi:hypothetical protein